MAKILFFFHNPSQILSDLCFVIMIFRKFSYYNMKLFMDFKNPYIHVNSRSWAEMKSTFDAVLAKTEVHFTKVSVIMDCII